MRVGDRVCGDLPPDIADFRDGWHGEIIQANIRPGLHRVLWKVDEHGEELPYEFITGAWEDELRPTPPDPDHVRGKEV